MSSEVVHCKITELERVLCEAYDSTLTPLILDTSEEDTVCTYFSYNNCEILEAKALILEAKRSLPDAMEKARKSLVNAMKYGKKLLIRLSNAAPDFLHNLNDDKLNTVQPLREVHPGNNNMLDSTALEAFFPKEVFFYAGAAMHNNEWIDRLYRDSERHPAAICRDSFKVFLVSKFELEDVDDFLFGGGDPSKASLPAKSNFKIINIDYGK